MFLIRWRNVMTWDIAINCLQDPLEFGFSVNVQPSSISSISPAGGKSVEEPVTKGRSKSRSISYNVHLTVAFLVEFKSWLNTVVFFLIVFF